MIYEPENLKNKRTMYEKKAKMLVTIEFFLWAVILFVYVNIVIPYVGSTIGFLTIIIGGIAIITAFYFFIAFCVSLCINASSSSVPRISPSSYNVALSNRSNFCDHNPISVTTSSSAISAVMYDGKPRE